MANLIFDFDGTIHDTARIYAPAFRSAYQYLIDKGLADGRSWQEVKIGIRPGSSLLHNCSLRPRLFRDEAAVHGVLLKIS